MVERLCITGLRAFSSTQTLQLAVPNGEAGSGITVVVGANNSGKSTVWESLQLAAQAPSEELIAIPENKRNRGSEDGVHIQIHLDGDRSLEVKSKHSDTSSAETLLNGLSREDANRLIDFVMVPSRRQFQPYFYFQNGTPRNWKIGRASCRERE